MRAISQPGNRINRRVVMTDRKRFISLAIVLASGVVAALTLVDWSWAQRRQHHEQTQEQPQEQAINEQFHRSLSQLGGLSDIRLIENIAQMIDEGRGAFRFDTFGDEAFWGDTLRLHQAIAGEKLGGVGPGISPRAAINLGFKVDADHLPKSLISQLYRQATLDDPAVTLALLKLQAVVGVTGFFNSDGSLRSVGLQCALCHSTVDNSVTFGIGSRVDGWANPDVDIGSFAALAPNLDPFAELLGVDVPTVSKGLKSWGPGWNLHKPEEIGIDSFQADRGPDRVYKTQNLAALFVRELGLFMRPENKGRFYHDGRFKTLLDVVNHYDIHFNLDLTDGEKRDLVEFLKSL